MPEDINRDQFEFVESLDMTQEHLGEESDFQDAQNAKDEFIVLANKYVELARTDRELDGNTRENVFNETNNVVAKFRKLDERIQTAVDLGKNHQQFSQKRKQHNGEAGSLLAGYRRSMMFPRVLMAVNDLSARLSAVENIRASQKEADDLLDEIKTSHEQAQQHVAHLHEMKQKKSILDAAENFNKLADEHIATQTWWFAGLIAAIIVFCVMVIYLFATEVTTVTKDASVGYVLATYIRRIVMISLPAVLIRICLTKYNTERNLGIIFKHRSTALNQYHILKDEQSTDEARAALLLETARLIFADPITGLTKTSPSSEVNINPLLTTVGAAARSASH